MLFIGSKQRILFIICKVISKHISDSTYLKSLYLVQNKNNISVKAENSLVCNIKVNGKLRYIKFATQDKAVFSAETDMEDMASGFSRILISDVHDVYMFSQQLADLFYRYVECSNAKECTHPDRLRAMCCGYRKHLKEGRIFYGQNCNCH